MLSTSSIDLLFEGKQRSDAPFLLAIGGGPNGGKSTLTQLLLDKGIIDPNSTVIIESSTFTNLISGYSKYNGHKHPEKRSDLQRYYYRIRKQIIDGAIARGISVVIDDHLDNRSQTIDMVNAARKEGYETALIGATIDPRNYNRFEQRRVRNTEHIPLESVLALQWHKNFSRHSPEYVKHFDISIFTEFNETKPTIIAHFSKDKKEGIVYDEERFREFTATRFINPKSETEEKIFPEGAFVKSSHFRFRLANRPGKSSEEREIVGLARQHKILEALMPISDHLINI